MTREASCAVKTFDGGWLRLNPVVIIESATTLAKLLPSLPMQGLSCDLPHPVERIVQLQAAG